MSDERAQLRIVPAVDMPEDDGGTMGRLTEKLVAIMTEQAGQAYINGFQAGLAEALKIVRGSRVVTPAAVEAIDGLLARWATEGESGA